MNVLLSVKELNRQLVLEHIKPVYKSLKYTNNKALKSLITIIGIYNIMLEKRTKRVN